MKLFRAWDFLIRYIGGDNKICGWRRPEIQEEIALYLDVACRELDHLDV